MRAAGGDDIVRGVSFEVAEGQILGIVGESGAGKTTAALALLGFARTGMQITEGTVRLAGEALSLGDERACRRVRGRLISYVPQDPQTALNPSTRIGDAIREMMRQYGGEAEGDVATPLERVTLPGDFGFQRRYPHELSGGQQQRVCIAIALACDPPVVVLDEPTTGLDVVTQGFIIRLLDRLREERDVAMVYVSHNLAVVSQLADRVAVMYAGRVVEMGPTDEIVSRALHPYTRGLVNAIPDHREPRAVRGIPGRAPESEHEFTGCAFAPRCGFRTSRCEADVPPLSLVGDGHHVRCIHVDRVKAAGADATPPFRWSKRGAAGSPIIRVEELSASYDRSNRTGDPVVRDVSFSIDAGECVALVGESGAGKSTIARALVGLHPIASGAISLRGERLETIASRRTRDQRRAVQLIFQNPDSALNPRQNAGEAIVRAATVLRKLDRVSAEREMRELLGDVRLAVGIARRYPRELSGGELQRVAIARALAANPSLLVCDEVTSALDVSVQAAILELLTRLRQEHELSILYITHDLGVVTTIADRVMVLQGGLIQEEGPVDQILTAPRHPYTQRLLQAAPSIAS